MNETLEVSGDRTSLRIERRFGYPPEKVWCAVTDPAHLNQWFPFNVEVDLRVGGEMRFIPAQPDAGPTMGGVVTELDPPRVFAFTWADDLLRFELQADGDDSLLIFTHTFADHFGAASFAAGWQTCFDAMETTLAAGQPAPPSDIAELHDAYVVALGLDEGWAEETADGWAVRFERQMTRPIEDVWAAVRGTEVPHTGDPVPPGFTTAEFPAGPVSTVDPPKLLEYDWWVDGRVAGRVRWELGDGTGQGARLFLTQTGPIDRSDAKTTALATWKARIDELAARLRTMSHEPAGSGQLK